MLPLANVKHLDVFEAGSLHLGLRRVVHTVVSLVLEAVEPALGRRIISAISLATHRARHAKFGQFALVSHAGVLAASVGVMQYPRCGTPAEPCHRQRIGHKVCSHE